MTRPPILVTGVPRSGTTWLARTLANAPGTALAGREPMNPRARQYALGGSLSAWTRLTALSAAQRRSLRLAYRGLNPYVYSRYGHRQLLAPLPGTQVIVKDPFAMLSLPIIVATTGAVPVLVFRHPGAVLSSYRRMGWSADVDEIDSALPGQLPMVDAAPAESDPSAGDVREAADMARFWVVLNTQSLRDIESMGNALVVAHEDVTLGGATAMRRLYGLLALPWSASVESAVRQAADTDRSPKKGPAGLHDFTRSPEDVAGSWRKHITEAELQVVERIAGAALSELSDRRAILR